MNNYSSFSLKIVLLSLLLFSCFFASKSSADVIRIKIPPARSDFDISHDYHIKLLTKALQHSMPEISIEFYDSVPMSQGRAETELIKGEKIDVYWFGTNTDIEQKLRAIPIPTTRGLIGFRKLLINKKLISNFDEVRNLKDLQTHIACQGTHWPDTKILNNAGLAVTTSTDYENLFQMTSKGRCDYFPRGYHDAINELKIRQNTYPALISYDRIMLHYPFAVYFFTNKSNLELALQIELGLHHMAKTGGILSFMKTHPLTRPIFPITSEAQSLYLPITNPYISNNNFSDRLYWFTPQDFDITNAQ